MTHERRGTHPFLRGERPVLMAHRGGAAEAPENSAAAIARLASIGVRYLETDAHASKDGVVVLTHDPTLDRTTDGSGDVRDLTWEQLALLRDVSGEPLQRLTDLLAAHPDLYVNVDAKSDDVVEPLARAVAGADALHRVNLASFSAARLRRLRRLLGGRAATSLGTAEVVHLRLAASLPGVLGRIARTGLPGPRRGAVCVQVPERRGVLRVVSPSFVAAAHAHGLDVHVWTVDDPAQASRLLAMGVDGIISDRPAAVRPVVRPA